MFYRADCDPGIRVPVYCTQSNKTNPVDYIVGGSIVCVSKSITDGFNEVFDDAVSKVYEYRFSSLYLVRFTNCSRLLQSCRDL